MASLPGRPLSQPQFLLIDTDALLQLLVISAVEPLRVLNRVYKVHTAIAEAVADEMPGKLRDPRFIDRRGMYDKSLRRESLVVIDSKTLNSYRAGAAEAAEEMQSRLYGAGAGRGEAHSHALGIVLQSPVVSNDIAALRSIQQTGIQLPYACLRAFDLVVFLHQTGNWSIHDCEAARQLLIEKREFVPRCFVQRSFEDGLPSFFARLVDPQCSLVGSLQPTDRERERIRFMPT